MRVLVIEDEPNLRRLLTRLLNAAGFETVEAGSGTQGLTLALTADFDLIILDLILPDVAGEYVLDAVLSVKPDARVMVVSSVEDIGRRVGVLDSGATDFVAKPFANAELLARVRARTRVSAGTTQRLSAPGGVPDVESRADNPVDSGTGRTVDLPSAPIAVQSPAALELVADIRPAPRSHPAPILPNPPAMQRCEEDAIATLDMRRRALVLNGRVIDLSQREFVLMAHLLHRRGQVCTREELLADVWGVQFDPGTNIVAVYVRRLRNKLADNSIETVRNVGYRLVA